MYQIVRFYAPHLKRPSRNIGDPVAPEVAIAHCNREDSRKEDEWFDGWRDLNSEPDPRKEQRLRRMVNVMKRAEGVAD